MRAQYLIYQAVKFSFKISIREEELILLNNSCANSSPNEKKAVYKLIGSPAEKKLQACYRFLNRQVQWRTETFGLLEEERQSPRPWRNFKDSR